MYFHRYIARPFVHWLGVRGKPPVKVSANGACEKVYKKNKKPNMGSLPNIPIANIGN